MTENTEIFGKTEKTKKTKKAEKDKKILRSNSNTNGISKKYAYYWVGGRGDAGSGVADQGFCHPKED